MIGCGFTWGLCVGLFLGFVQWLPAPYAARYCKILPSESKCSYYKAHYLISVFREVQYNDKEDNEKTDLRNKMGQDKEM